MIFIFKIIKNTILKNPTLQKISKKVNLGFGFIQRHSQKILIVNFNFLHGNILVAIFWISLLNINKI